MPEVVYVGIAADRRGKLLTFLALDLEVYMYGLRASGPHKLLYFEEFGTVREAVGFIGRLGTFSPKALRALIKTLNPKRVDLMPDPAFHGGSRLASRECTSPDPYISSGYPDRDDLRWILGDDDLPGEGGVGARLPKGPAPLSGSCAQTFPTELDWPEFIGPDSYDVPEFFSRVH